MDTGRQDNLLKKKARGEMPLESLQTRLENYRTLRSLLSATVDVLGISRFSRGSMSCIVLLEGTINLSSDKISCL